MGNDLNSIYIEITTVYMIPGSEGIGYAALAVALYIGYFCLTVFSLFTSYLLWNRYKAKERIISIFVMLSIIAPIYYFLPAIIMEALTHRVPQKTVVWDFRSSRNVSNILEGGAYQEGNIWFACYPMQEINFEGNVTLAWIYSITSNSDVSAIHFRLASQEKQKMINLALDIMTKWKLNGHKDLNKWSECYDLLSEYESKEIPRFKMTKTQNKFTVEINLGRVSARNPDFDMDVKFTWLDI
jgi:hypothetical protein